MQQTTSSLVLYLLLLLLPLTAAVRNLRIASPLQTLTLWDKTPTTPRSRFLPRFRQGLKAEIEARQKVAQADSSSSNAAVGGGDNWAQQAAAADRKRQTRVERAASRAFEQAFAAADADNAAATTDAAKTTPPPPRSSKYQFVGVVNSPRQSHVDGKPPITWYARPKPTDSAWSVRLVHVNRQAVLYDLFRRGKVDVFAKYKNLQGKTVVDEEGVTTRQPVIKAEYTVRERSWK